MTNSISSNVCSLSALLSASHHVYWAKYMYTYSCTPTQGIYEPPQQSCSVLVCGGTGRSAKCPLRPGTLRQAWDAPPSTLNQYRSLHFYVKLSMIRPHTDLFVRFGVWVFQQTYPRGVGHFQGDFQRISRGPHTVVGRQQKTVPTD